MTGAVCIPSIPTLLRGRAVLTYPGKHPRFDQAALRAGLVVLPCARRELTLGSLNHYVCSYSW